jgi:hypothetical protein
MATFIRYFISGIAADLLDARAANVEYSLSGQTLPVTGSGGLNTLRAAPGVDLDARNLLVGEDVIIFNYSWAQYTKTLVSGGIAFSYTDPGTGLTERVTVSNGATSLGRDKLVFTDGAVLTQNANAALGTSLTAPITAVTGHDATLSTGNIVTPTPAGNTLRAFASTTDATGGTFAAAEGGQTLVVAGSSAVDKLYVKAGANVDARSLLGGTDQIFFTGSWGSYTKSLVSGGIQLTRVVGGLTESITVSNGATALGRDLLVFADGAVGTQQANAALTVSATSAITAVSGYDATNFTPGLPLDTLTSAQLASLSAEKIAGLTSAQIASLLPGQVALLSTVQLTALTTSQVGSLNATQTTALTITQLDAVTPTQIAALTPAALAAMSVSQLSSLTERRQQVRKRQETKTRCRGRGRSHGGGQAHQRLVRDGLEDISHAVAHHCGFGISRERSAALLQGLREHHVG